MSVIHLRHTLLYSICVSSAYSMQLLHTQARLNLISVVIVQANYMIANFVVYWVHTRSTGAADH